MPTTRYGSVTTAAPITVTLDGETSPVAATPINLGPTLAVGDRVACEFRDKSLVIIGAPLNASRDLWFLNSRRLTTGGGVRAATTTGVSWSPRFSCLGAGAGPWAPGGYFQIDMPPDGTVIPVSGHTSQTSATVSGGIVPLALWQTLWYDVPAGSATTASQPSRFKVTSYHFDFDPIPPTWLPLVTRSGDSSSYVWIDGRETQPWTYPTLGGGWANYVTGGYASARYKREHGTVYVEGLVKSGTVGSGTPLFTLPAGYRPDTNLIFVNGSSGGLADIRVFSSGAVYVYSLYSGTNASVSITCSFPADV